jgi:hypothetical protein
MVSPQQIAPILQRLVDETAAAPDGVDTGRSQSRLYYSAMMGAVKGTCDCGPCKLLREAADTLLVEPKG